MGTNEKEKSNSLIPRAITGGIPANITMSVTMGISMMINTMLAGMYLSPESMAAIGVAMPIFLLILSLFMACNTGCTLIMSAEIGRGNKENTNRAFSFGITIPTLLGIIITVVMFCFGEQAVMLFGAGTPALIEDAATYLKLSMLAYIFGQVGVYANTVLRLFAKNTLLITSSILQIIIASLTSWLLLVTTDLGIGSLALGNVVAQTVTSVVNGLGLRGTGVKWKLYRHDVKEIIKVFKLGLPSASDMFADSLAAGVVNNIIIANLGPMGLAVNAVVKSVYNVYVWGIGSLSKSASPVIALLYGMRDKSGLRQVLRSCYKLAVPTMLFGIVVVFVGMPVLLPLYGAGKAGGVDADLVRMGVWILVAFSPVRIYNLIMTSFYEATENFTHASLNGIIADSVINPIILALIMPVFGYPAMWMSVGISCIVFHLIDYTVICIKRKKLVRNLYDLMNLNTEINEHVPQLDISIKNDNEQITGISERIFTFLKGAGLPDTKAHHTALCLEELAVDMTEQAKLSTKHPETFTEKFDIKMFVDKDDISLMIRSASTPYNPLMRETDPMDPSGIGIRIVQKLARKIEYSYILKMNVIQIVL